MIPKSHIPSKVIEVIKKFKKNNAEIYIVGGTVRDLLIHRKPKDWDFTTNLTPEKIQTLFPKNSFYNNDFGTVSIVVSPDDIYEITTYRTESEYSDFRRPDKVCWGKTVEEDLLRRDFTINAMAYDPDSEEFIDPHGGRSDLDKKIIKCVGSPDDRFREDALRLMRAIRLASQLGFSVELSTFTSIQKNAGLIKKIAAERVRDEILKLIMSSKPTDAFRLFRNSGLLVEIIPEIIFSVGHTQKGHHIYDVWEHSLKSLEYCDSTDPITRFATFLHDIGKPSVSVGEGESRTFHNHEIVGAGIALDIGKRLRFSKLQINKLVKLVRYHMFTCEEKQTDSAVRRFIRNVTPDYLDDMITLRRADRIGSGAKETSWRWELFKKRLIEVQKQPFSVKDLKVNGHDVMELLGISPGPRVGEILDKLFAEVEKDLSLNDRDKLLELVTKLQ